MGGSDPWDSERKVPRQPHAMGNPRPDQNVPRQTPTKEERWTSISSKLTDALGDSLPEGCHSRTDPVIQSHQGKTFAKERALSLEENLEHDTNVDVAYWLPPLTWLTKEVPHKMAKWSIPRDEAGTILGKGDADLEYPPPLKPHLQHLLSGEEPSLVNAKVGGGLPPMSTSPPPSSMSKDLEPSPLHVSDCIEC